MDTELHGEDLSGQVIVITGALGDIGLAIARRLAGHGASIVAWDLADPDEGTKVLQDSGVAAAYRRVDIADQEAVLAALGERALPDGVDVIFANAGVSESSPFLELSLAQWEAHLRTNLTGSFITAQAAARAMVRNARGGRIVFTGSWIGEVAWPEQAAYSASKAGLVMLTRTMALELASSGILVNVLAPGIVDAGMARRQRLAEPQYAERAAQAIPLGRMQTVEQVASVAHFLCSSAADYITGTVMVADGGASLGNRL